MMQEQQFSDVVDLIRKEDSRFGKGAYRFVQEALDFTIRKRQEETPRPTTRHVTGQELLEGIREFALEQYGPMTKTLLSEWGIEVTLHFGEIVFQLIDYGILGKTKEDSLEDFADGYDFEEAFCDPFLPESKRAKKSGRSTDNN
ncbi:MAG TPA: Minf_1886 family protein [Opitutales bacterium]|nr:Minf_1886 family protein [Opitutales bacterium]